MREYVGYRDPRKDDTARAGVTDERVVRCRNCVNHDTVGMFPTCSLLGGSWADDDFCSKGYDRRDA